MKTNDWLQILAFLAALLALTPLLGTWMARVFAGERHLLSPLTAPIERLVFRASGVDAEREMTWRAYAGAMLTFNLLGMLAVLMLQLTQAWLPGNPQGLPNVPFALALNTAVSFMTNTNWQAYSGEATLSYTTQAAGLAVQNFVSAATGIAVLLALTRGLARKSSATIGNFWADLTRGTVSVLLPLALVFAVVLVSQGVVQTFAPYAHATTLDGAEQIIPLGPAASQIAIKQLGTNGGGFFGVNSAHPFENPTPLSNFLQVLAILALPAALTFTYGRLVGDARQGRVIFGAMLVLFVAGFTVSWAAELQGNPVTGLAGSLEGKETRFGVMNSVLWSSATTCASNGSVNAMHDSLSPLAGGIALFNILLGEVVFGGVGAGLYGMLMFVLVTVFLCGLMVGRTPEYLGKKIEAREVKWALVAVLAPSVLILVGACAAIATPLGTATLNNAGPHGLSEILYAYASAAGNNGSAFAGLGVNTDFYNYTLAAAMLLGRFGVILPVLAIAGSLAAKKSAPPSSGTFPTHGATFGLLLVAVVLIVGALTFFPVLSLGPIAEHFLMQQGRAF
jgi:K+-transporting ATPase ATPase A chain